MTGRMRIGTALVVGLLGFAAQASAQIPGMPLFTNPRYGTGLRVHADVGQPTEAGTSLGDLTVVQAGASLALGPIGLNAMVGMLRDDLSEAQTCVDHPDLDCKDNTVSASVLGQLRIAGGGRSSLSLSLFGGAAMTVKAAEFADLTDAQKAELGIVDAKELTVPVGVAVGLRIPLGLASLNLWGAPRMSLTRWVNCAAICPENESNFRWAVGADLPILRIFSIRAAYDSGKIEDETVSYWGIGASIGIGGMR
jgi:hypothetical protein